jgi:hypothetical protein
VRLHPSSARHRGPNAYAVAIFEPGPNTTECNRHEEEQSTSAHGSHASPEGRSATVRRIQPHPLAFTRGHARSTSASNRPYFDNHGNNNRWDTGFRCPRFHLNHGRSPRHCKYKAYSASQSPCTVVACRVYGARMVTILTLGRASFRNGVYNACSRGENRIEQSARRYMQTKQIGSP